MRLTLYNGVQIMDKITDTKSITIERTLFNTLKRQVSFLEEKVKKLDLENMQLKQDNYYLKNQLAIMTS